MPFEIVRTNKSAKCFNYKDTIPQYALKLRFTFNLGELKISKSLCMDCVRKLIALMLLAD